MRFGAWTSLCDLCLCLFCLISLKPYLSPLGRRRSRSEARGGGAPRRQAARPPGPATRETRARTVGIANRDAIMRQGCHAISARRRAPRDQGAPDRRVACWCSEFSNLLLSYFMYYETPRSPLHKKLDITNDRSTLPPPLFSALRQLGSQVDGGSRAASAATPTRLAARAKAAPCPRAAGGLAPLLLVRWTYPLAQVGGPACLFAVFARELPAQVAAAAPAATCLRTARGRRHGLNHVRWLSRRGGAAAEAGGACCDSGI